MSYRVREAAQRRWHSRRGGKSGEAVQEMTEGPMRKTKRRERWVGRKIAIHPPSSGEWISLCLRLINTPLLLSAGRAPRCVGGHNGAYSNDINYILPILTLQQFNRSLRRYSVKECGMSVTAHGVYNMMEVRCCHM